MVPMVAVKLPHTRTLNQRRVFRLVLDTVSSLTVSCRLFRSTPTSAHLTLGSSPPIERHAQSVKPPTPVLSAQSLQSVQPNRRETGEIRASPLSVSRDTTTCYRHGRPSAQFGLTDFASSDAAPSVGLASDGLASDGLASDGLASDGLASDGLASVALASDGAVLVPELLGFGSSS
ncbi:MAG TPA: hypothetical protein DCE43_20400 [Planctomycetaceae bacterium]|nr:hypothetical protein [Planctomycetaceae bacterium]